MEMSVVEVPIVYCWYAKWELLLEACGLVDLLTVDPIAGLVGEFAS
jgi:hypothetical protein